MCVEHARAARELARQLSPDIAALLPRARRLMLEARANLEQWRVAVLRSDALEDDERQMIQMVMGVARSDLETSYGMLPRTPQAENAPETLEYALRRTRRALVAVLLEIGRLRDDDDALTRLQREDLDDALTTRQAYSRVLLRIEAEQGSVDDRLERARSASDELCSICLDTLEVPDARIMRLACAHEFHAPCVERWLHTHSTCPYCRRQLQQD